MQAQTFTPTYSFVYIVDSPSSKDLYGGETIGMALRDALNAIRIPCFYTLTSDRNNFELALKEKLPTTIHQLQGAGNVNAHPFIHLCMHGAQNGICLTDNSFMQWHELRNILFSHNYVKGYDPTLCMASCNGLYGIGMANAFDSAFTLLVGNTGQVLQSDVTVAYLAFYNMIFHKRATIDQAVAAMKAASGDNNFYYASGQAIKGLLSSLTLQTPIMPTGSF